MSKFKRQFAVKIEKKGDGYGDKHEDGGVTFFIDCYVRGLFNRRIQSYFDIEVDGCFNYEGLDGEDIIRCLLDVKLNRNAIGSDVGCLRGEYSQEDKQWTLDWYTF